MTDKPKEIKKPNKFNPNLLKGARPTNKFQNTNIRPQNIRPQGRGK